MSEAAIFPTALLRLLMLQGRAFVRRTLRSFTSPRRAIFLIIGLGTLFLWFGSIILSKYAAPRHDVEMSDARFRQIAPIALCGICLLTIISSATDRAIAFTAGEVDILFPGPFTRRQLLCYKLFKSATGALLTAVLVTIGMSAYSHYLLAAYLGTFLTLQFIQLFSTAGVLLTQAVGRRFQHLLRRAAIVIVVIAVVMVGRQVMQNVGGVQGVVSLGQSDIGQAILRPFEPFGNSISARSLSDFAINGAEAAGIDIGLIAVVILLDANYLEAALSASQRRYAHVQRIRSGQMIHARIRGDVKWSLPRIPYFHGIGPIVWRQATNAARSARGLLMILVIIAAGSGPAISSLGPNVEPVKVLFPVLIWATVLLSGLMKFDFRGDLDHFDALKALPLRAIPLAVGQIIVPAVILTAFHVIALIGAAAVTKSDRDIMIVAAVLALPFNALLTAGDNLIFLLFPARPVAASPGDFQMMGRQTTQIIAKGFVSLLGASLAIGVAIPMYQFTHSHIVLAVVAGGLLIGETCALVPLIAWAFRRFDPSVDTPA